MKRFAWALLGVGGFVLAAELIARSLFGLGSPVLVQKDSALEYVHRPWQDLRRFGHRTFINGDGMRSDPMAKRPAPGMQRVLVFGDSVVFGGAQNDQAAIATSVLQRELRRLGRTIEVANVSAGSWGPGNWKAWAQTRGFFGATDVILVVSSHDAVDNPTFSDLEPTSHPTSNPPSALSELLVRYLNPDRIRYQMDSWCLPFCSSVDSGSNSAANSATNSASRMNRLDAGPSRASRLDPSPAAQQGLGDLRAFLEAAKASGARLSVVQFWDRNEAATGLPSEGHDLVLSLLNEMKIPVVQGGDVFRGCSAQPAHDLYVDPIHPYTVKGQACLAKALKIALDRAKRF